MTKRSIRIITTIAFVVALVLSIYTLIGLVLKVEVYNFHQYKSRLEEGTSSDELARCQDMKNNFREVIDIPEGAVIVDDYLTSGQVSGVGYIAEYHYLIQGADGRQTVKVLESDPLLSRCVAAYCDGLIDTFPSVKQEDNMLCVSSEDASNYEFVTYAFVWEGASSHSD